MRENGERPKEVSKTTGSSPRITPKSEKSYEISSAPKML